MLMPKLNTWRWTRPPCDAIYGKRILIYAKKFFSKNGSKKLGFFFKSDPIT